MYVAGEFQDQPPLESFGDRADFRGTPSGVGIWS
jgi:hypothetical protein